MYELYIRKIVANDHSLENKTVCQENGVYRIWKVHFVEGYNGIFSCFLRTKCIKWKHIREGFSGSSARAFHHTDDSWCLL